MNKLASLLLILFATSINAQTSGTFGGDAGASGYPNAGNTKNKWLKLGTMTLDGNYKRGSIYFDQYPAMSPHADSRQTLLVNLGTDANGNVHVSANDIVLITHYGLSKAINDVKVVHTAGGGSTAVECSIWVQMGSGYVSSVPIEYRVRGFASFLNGNQPYFEAIQESGTVYDLTSNYGMFSDNFGIGTTTPSEALEVNGTIRTKEVKVEASPWPDYVFDPDYELRSLEETEAFIKENKHLPEVPPASELEANGLSLGEMNRLLMKKIEELTLHLIEVNKENDKMKKEIGELRNSPRPSDTPLFSKRGDGGELEKKIEELTLHTIEQQKQIEELKTINSQLLNRIERIEANSQHEK